MTPAEVAAKLRAFNEWRRGGHIEYPGPLAVDEAIDMAIEMIDRLEAAESEVLEEARLNGMGSEREAALMAKLEAAEKERDALSAAVRHEADCVDAAKAEIDALRTKIAEMERQEPTRDWWDCLISDISAIDCMYRGSPTYTHNAYWMQEHVVQILEQRRDAIPAQKENDDVATD